LAFQTVQSRLVRSRDVRKRPNILGVDLELPCMFRNHGMQLLHRGMQGLGGAHQKFQPFVNRHAGFVNSSELGGQGRIRTFVPRKEGQIYSLLALTTHPPVRSDFQSITCERCHLIAPPESDVERFGCGRGVPLFPFYLPA
jgi:hypothetical protein